MRRTKAPASDSMWRGEKHRVLLCERLGWTEHRPSWHELVHKPCSSHYLQIQGRVRGVRVFKCDICGILILTWAICGGGDRSLLPEVVLDTVCIVQYRAGTGAVSENRWPPTGFITFRILNGSGHLNNVRCPTVPHSTSSPASGELSVVPRDSSWRCIRRGAFPQLVSAITLVMLERGTAWLSWGHRKSPLAEPSSYRWPARPSRTMDSRRI